ncbi:hypothetical protein FOZ61_010918 [Perkinsus olseni]|uniref:Uncharacterized protein n=1 Tax=Perkinsus olseni TaxID=32597 RepID=A0A7J6M1R0_PEROL|nr:hypothetical protein FOZ61_010918 [Perkinsus olseni]KAF4674362.1 hypothetical protein FOL46_005143 [Perkinsus olseni]
MPADSSSGGERGLAILCNGTLDDGSLGPEDMEVQDTNVEVDTPGTPPIPGQHGNRIDKRSTGIADDLVAAWDSAESLMQESSLVGVAIPAGIVRASGSSTLVSALRDSRKQRNHWADTCPNIEKLVHLQDTLRRLAAQDPSAVAVDELLVALNSVLGLLTLSYATSVGESVYSVVKGGQS